LSTGKETIRRRRMRSRKTARAETRSNSTNVLREGAMPGGWVFFSSATSGDQDDDDDDDNGNIES